MEDSRVGVGHWTAAMAVVFATAAQASPDLPVSVAGKSPDPVEAGERICVAGHKVNLRKSPTTRGRIVARLDLGTELMVRATVPGGPVALGGRRDWWYQVIVLDENDVAETKGYIYGGVLTRACLRADLDDDGELEVATVSMNPDGIVVVRVFEPYGGSDKSLTIPAARAGGQLLRHAQIDVLSANDTGVPLLQVTAHGAESDVPSGKVSYVAYRAEAATLAGKLTLALSHVQGGEVDGKRWNAKTRFDADDRTVHVTTRSGAEKVVRRYEWSGKTYVERPDG